MLANMEKDLPSPIHVDKHGIDVLSTVLLDSHDRANLCTLFLTSVPRCPETTLQLLRDLTMRSKVLLQGLQGEKLNMSSLSLFARPEL